MDANTNPIELCGTVAAVIYQNEENGYTVLKLDVDDGSQTMVVGCIPYAVPGESMIVTGSWMTHPAHGQQFKAEFAERTMPETADTMTVDGWQPSGKAHIKRTEVPEEWRVDGYDWARGCG